MLRVIFGKIEGVVYNTSLYFKNVFDREWLSDDLNRRMIEDVDHSKVISGSAIDSPVMGVIPPTSLSGGVKTLILIHEIPDELFNASNCGDNCASWLLKMGEDHDITINLRHIMDFGDEKFEIFIENTGETVHDMLELAKVAGRFV